MTLDTFVYNNEKNALDNDEPRGSSLSFVSQEKNVEDDNKPRCSLSSFAT